MKLVPVNLDEQQKMIEAESKALSHYSIGFLKIKIENNQEDAVPAGSGTLVSVDSIKGILTAGHVLKNLPESGQVGIVRFFSNQFPQRTMIDMSHASKVIIWLPKNKQKGPDIGFLRLPDYAAGSLEARSSFYNLSKRREEVIAAKKKRGLFMDALLGIVAERTKEIQTEFPQPRLKAFGGLFGPGLIVKRRTRKNFDYSDFETTHEYDSPAPQSFGGMSGGSVWKLSLRKEANESLTVLDKRLDGIAFYESEIDANKKRIISCHGPKSVYRELIDAIQKEWPDLK